MFVILSADIVTNNYVKYSYLSGQFENKNISDNIDLSKISYSNMSKFSYNRFALDTDIEFYTINELPEKYKNVSLDYTERQGMTLNTFMASYRYENIATFVGVIPFKGGKFASIKNEEINNGNGIELIIDQVLNGAFVCYNKQDYSIKIGYAFWEEKNNYVSLANKNNRSDGTYLLANYEIKNKDFSHYFEFNYFNVNPLMDQDTNSPYELGHLDLLGVGYILNTTNFVFYAEGAMSVLDERVSKTAETSVPAAYIPFLNA